MNFKYLRPLLAIAVLITGCGLDNKLLEHKFPLCTGLSEKEMQVQIHQYIFEKDKLADDKSSAAYGRGVLTDNM
ncbi:MAG: hypothetical protein H6492_02945 [Candidatus Paracaedibacteraceae bacterium]|nr:hypothetical protein [Candidatus Paracaedibacteraceae bacterium]